MRLMDTFYDARARKGRPKYTTEVETTPLGVISGRLGTVVGTDPKGYLVRIEDREAVYTKSPDLEPLVVGDMAYLSDDVIVGRLERRSFLARMRRDTTRKSTVFERHVMAANMDIAVIVVSVANPAFHPRFIDRYLIACQDGSVQPLICLTKIDLTDERHPLLAQYRDMGIQTIETSQVSGAGIDELMGALKGLTAVFVGASGVGKSSLVNALSEKDVTKTGELSKKSGRGRHTTSKSSLYDWAENSYIIDTPGIRSLGLDHIPKTELEGYFPEFESFREECKYANCSHMHEPECGIKNAVKEGQITVPRYESYVRLMQE